MSRSKNTVRKSCLGLLAVLLLATLVVAGLMATALLLVPQQAAAAFGEPAPGLNPFQRVYLSALLLLRSRDLTAARDPAAGDVDFKVSLGESPAIVAIRLQEDGLIKNADAFRNYLVYRGLDTTLQAGDYTLSARMTPIEIAEHLQDATPSQIKFNLLPGWRLEEIAAALPTSGLGFTAEEFMAAAHQHPAGYDFLKDVPVEASLEGFLFPGTYQLPRETTAENFVDALLKAFGEHLTPDLRAGFDRQGLSLYEAVTLASIVQREAVVADEMPMIASVYLNRLKESLKLDADPTVQYALGADPSTGAWWKSPLSLADLEIDSPYNTYKVPGLPPGPIANPDLNALRAVAFSAQTPYFYFRAACDGSGRHTFARNLDEQVQNACP